MKLDSTITGVITGGAPAGAATARARGVVQGCYLDSTNKPRERHS